MELIIFLVALGIYLGVMYLLVVYVGPPFVVVASLVFVALVPVLYGRSLFRVFGQDATGTIEGGGWRNLALAPVVAILVLCYLDFASLTLTFFSATHFTRFIHGFAAEPLWQLNSAFLWPAVTVGIPNHLTVDWSVRLLPVGIPQWVVVILSAAMKMATLPPFLLLARGFLCHTEGAGQPARLAYFHGEAFPDLGNAIRLCVDDLYGMIKLIGTRVYGFTTGGAQGCLIWPIAISIGLALAAPAVVGVIALGLLIVMHSVALALLWAVAMFLSAFLFCAERAVLLARAGYARCPHSKCHASVPLPSFQCPECGVLHDRLVPGKFGLFLRSCKCGLARLPTMAWWGKGQLDAHCPKCGQPMAHALFGGSVHVPIVGGPSAGKTMFMIANAWSLLEGRVPRVEASLIDEVERIRYSNRWKPDYEAGQWADKTLDHQQDAFLLSLRRKPGLPISLYLYDAAGEVFEHAEQLRHHRFYRYIDGLALVIDPLSFPEVAERFRETGGPDLSDTTSAMNPRDLLDRLRVVLEEHSHLMRHRKFRRRLAVVLTKADLPGMGQELGMNLDERPLGDRWSDLGEVESAKVRTWLKQNARAMQHELESEFDDIRYFAVSATGHVPGSGRAFTPRRVVEPLAWLLSKRQTLARPLLARIQGRAAEAAAVALVVALFFGPPAWAVDRWLVPLVWNTVEVIELKE